MSLSDASPTYRPVATPDDYKACKSQFSIFSTRVLDTAGNSLAAGLVVDFAKFDEDDVEAKEVALLRALADLHITERPCMVLDLAPVRALELDVDGKEWVESEEEARVAAPPCARIVMPVSHIADISNIQPQMGSSVLRCNGSIPTYRWFQAINLLLHEKKKPGRVVPFPLEQKDGNVTYQAIRVSAEEFRRYQDLLTHCVDLDGPEKGFFVAAKYAYQIFADRGHTELTYAKVGSMVTDIIIMKNSLMRGVLLLNSTAEDLETVRRLSIYY